MKDSHLTLRIPADLARALARWAKSRGVPKSQLVREAVARYLAPSSPPAERPPSVTARTFAGHWASLPRLTPEEACDLETDIAAARAGLPPVRTPWA
jgi:Ribbon-helix-helix protein, copG family